MTSEQFEHVLPLVVAWAENQESQILASGVHLTTAQISDARQLGVVHPERVRLLETSIMPVLEDSIRREAAEIAELVSPFTAGLTFRYGIRVRSDFWGDRFLIAHELVHTAQYERLGSMEAFLRRYIQECLTIGYFGAPMEQEAIMAAENLRRIDR